MDLYTYYLHNHEIKFDENLDDVRFQLKVSENDRRC